MKCFSFPHTGRPVLTPTAPVLLMVAAAWLVASCISREAIDSAPVGSVELRVMTFNVEWGGALISFDNVVAAIQQSGADIVGIQEAEGNLFRIADALGWYADESNYLLSRFPVYAVPGAEGRYSWVEVVPGFGVAVANVHLPSDPYGPDAVRDGAAAVEVLELERTTRLPAIQRHLATLQPLVESNVPIFVTGDFNAPSHEDWIDATVASRKFLRFPLAWPVSQAMQEAGFTDSWRAVHPDPLAHPGLTWWARRPPLAAYAPGNNDAEDRIDFIWSANTESVQDSVIVGERGRSGVSIGLAPWPSDHRAVVSHFRLQPAVLPPLASTGKRVYRTDEKILIHAFSPEIAVLSLHSAEGGLLEKWPLRGHGSQRHSAADFGPGRYQVILAKTENDVSPPYEFWILDTAAPATITTDEKTYISGESIAVSWQNAPGLRNDYVAAYKPDVATDYDNGLAWAYTGARPHGMLRLDGEHTSWGWPLPAGRFVIRLVQDDGYEALAESMPFEVVSLVASIANNITTYDDGRRSLQSLFAAYQQLLDVGWRLDVIAQSEPDGVAAALPIIALRSPVEGAAIWVLAGIHGEEPAGPNAIAAGIPQLAALGKVHPVVLLPLLNPHGYARNWRYLNMPHYDESIDGMSVGDSSHLLQDPERPGLTRASVANAEADAITRYVLFMAERYPPRLSLDLHEDNLIDAGYVYSQGERGSGDKLAARAVTVLRQHGIAIKMDGQTRFGETISAGIVGPVADSSIDELMSTDAVLIDGERRRGPRAETVLVFETPARALSLPQRVSAHLALLQEIAETVHVFNE